MNTCIEYIWIDGKQNLRCKTKVMNKNITTLDDLPQWNYDGSSTYQAPGTDSEIIIKPCKLYNDPFRGNHHKLVLCDTYTPDGNPHESNTRYNANKIFLSKTEEEPWFGLEQEYFLINNETKKPLGFPVEGMPKPQGDYYCSIGANNNFGRHIAEEHLSCCLHAGITISGINAEVAPGQWEFQIGPCVGIDQGDDLWMARYLLGRVSEKYNVSIDYEPKPLKDKEDCEDESWNGSGCHANFSTKNMRQGKYENNGLYYIESAIDKLSLKHKEHMDVYGSGNKDRMTGKHETASFDIFTKGIVNRGASIRIGSENYNNKQGYFEDRRPSSNCDPYLVTSKIFETCCL